MKLCTPFSRHTRKVPACHGPLQYTTGLPFESRSLFIPITSVTTGIAFELLRVFKTMGAAFVLIVMAWPNSVVLALTRTTSWLQS